MAGENKNNSISKPMMFVVGTFVVVVILAASFDIGGIVALDYELTSDDYTKILTSMFFIALLVERFIEVTITVSRSNDKDVLKADLAAAKEKKDADEQKKVNDQLIAHRNGTEKKAMTVGFLIGVLLGLAGVQVLGSLFDVTYLEGIQKFLFKGMDILLTAALVAGGSNGVKQVTSLFRDFMDKNRPTT